MCKNFVLQTIPVYKSCMDKLRDFLPSWPSQMASRCGWQVKQNQHPADKITTEVCTCEISKVTGSSYCGFAKLDNNCFFMIIDNVCKKMSAPCQHQLLDRKGDTTRTALVCLGIAKDDKCAANELFHVVNSAAFQHVKWYGIDNNFGTINFHYPAKTKPRKRVNAIPDFWSHSNSSKRLHFRQNRNSLKANCTPKPQFLIMKNFFFFFFGEGLDQNWFRETTK